MATRIQPSRATSMPNDEQTLFTEALIRRVGQPLLFSKV